MKAGFNKAGLNIDAHAGLRVVLVIGFLLVLAANLPGHLSYDSVAQLYEGHFHVRETWGPVVYAWLLGLFDAVIPGTALYVVASLLALFLSIASFGRLRARVGWLGVVVTALVLLTPQVLVFQAIVWKDVMFANTAIAGVVLIAHAVTAWADVRRRTLCLIGAAVLLSLASLVRQNGIVVTLLAAVALGWCAATIPAQGRRWLRGVGWGLGLIVAVLLLGQVFTRIAEPPRAGPDTAVKEGVRIVQHYDLIGAMALDHAYRLDMMRRADPVATQVVETRGPPQYAGDRIDYLDRDEALGAALWSFSDKPVRTQWFDLILHHPALYLRVRAEDFRWVFLTPVIDKCLPVYVGVDAPAAKLAPLGLTPRYSETDVQLAKYHGRYVHTPAYSHLTYAVLALVLVGLLAFRREPADIAMGALLLSGVAFTASFFIITIACDYRYLYFSDLSALVGLAYVMLDFPIRGRRRVSA